MILITFYKLSSGLEKLIFHLQIQKFIPHNFLKIVNYTLNFYFYYFINSKFFLFFFIILSFSELEKNSGISENFFQRILVYTLFLEIFF